MKNYFLALVTLFFITSCDIDDSNLQYRLVHVPVNEVIILDEFYLGETYNIKFNYLRPSACHFYDGTYVERDDNVMTLAIQNYEIIGGGACNQLPNEEVEVNFNFYVENPGSYIFKFWQGKDTNGEDLFLIYEIPVID
jgi:hypothetical protein